MTIALCMISFTLGLIAIDMFCDHYVFVASSMTSAQVETCTSYYRNAAQQPWYMSLVTMVPIVVSALVMFKNITRSIYDMISAPLFLAVVGVFIVRVKSSVESLVNTTKVDKNAREGYLQQIAYSHAIMAGLLFVLIILQVLAKNTKKAVATAAPSKKNKTG